MCMCKEGWCVGFGQEGAFSTYGFLCGGGGNCLKYFKGGWNKKEWSGSKKFKSGRSGKAGLRGACLKKGEGMEPLYELWVYPRN